MSTYSKHFHYVIIIYAGKYPTGPILEKIEYKDMTWDIRMKYSWYLRYRSALAQVQHPRSYIESRSFSSEIKGKDELVMLRKAESTARGQVTKIINQMRKAKKHWNMLWPIEEDPLYLKAWEKLRNKRSNYLTAKEKLISKLNSEL